MKTEENSWDLSTWKSLVTLKRIASVDWRGRKAEQETGSENLKMACKHNSFENFAIQGSREMGQ